MNLRRSPVPPPSNTLPCKPATASAWTGKNTMEAGQGLPHNRENLPHKDIICLPRSWCAKSKKNTETRISSDSIVAWH